MKVDSFRLDFARADCPCICRVNWYRRLPCFGSPGRADRRVVGPPDRQTRFPLSAAILARGNERRKPLNTIVLVGPEGQVVCERCELADGFFTRGRGLLGRGHLRRGQGMLIRPTWSVHTAFMRFAIDVVFLDEDLTVLEITQRLRPWRAAFRRNAHQALELPAGECERLAIRVGDQLAWGSLEPEA